LWLNNGTGRGARQSAKGPVFHRLGMELWSYRRQLRKDLPGTLALIRQLGFTDIETASYYGHSAAEFRKMLDQAGLKCSSIVSKYEALASDIGSVIRDAQALGAHYVITANIPHKGRLTAEEVNRASADFNRWGAKLKSHGLQFGYHPHGFEFVPYGNGNLFDLMLSETRPGLVVYEMDVFWFAHGGANPVRYLQKHPKRFELVHLKDMAKGTATGIDAGRAPNDASVPLGAGQLGIDAIVRAAEKAGIKRYYIEDESPTAPQQVPVSLSYLRNAGL
jgi:sugar phosphate isomerase/epimerase